MNLLSCEYAIKYKGLRILELTDGMGDVIMNKEMVGAR